MCVCLPLYAAIQFECVVGECLWLVVCVGDVCSIISRFPRGCRDVVQHHAVLPLLCSSIDEALDDDDGDGSYKFVHIAFHLVAATKRTQTSIRINTNSETKSTITT